MINRHTRSHSEMTPPHKLYKYQPFTALSLQNLKNQIIYFGSPLNFNDPYDCALSPSIKMPTDADIKKIRRQYLSKPALAPAILNEFHTASTENLRAKFVKSAQNVLDNAIQEFLKKRGVSCFSENVDSLLMWSHYADHCKGFCLEFDTSTELFQKIKQVRYKSNIPEFDAVALLCDEGFDPVPDLYCTKAIDWAYENEWRSIHNEVGTSFFYPSEALTGVYFGPDMPFASLEIIALILGGQNEHVKLWQGKRSNTKFAVEFEQVSYTPYLRGNTAKS